MVAIFCSRLPIATTARTGSTLAASIRRTLSSFPRSEFRPAYASGFLLLVREGKLWRSRLMSGPSRNRRAVLSDRWRTLAFDRRAADFSVAQNGMLVFLSAVGSGQRLVWFDREGKELGVAVPDIGNPTSGLMAGALSPSGDRVRSPAPAGPALISGCTV